MIRLHHVPLTRSFRGLWLLEELGLDFEVKHYSIRDGSLRDPTYLALSPLGRVPALEIGDEVICESGAIVQVLCERHPGPGLAPAPNDTERARFLECFGIAETMASLLENLNMQHLFLRDPSQASPAVIKLTTARLRASLAMLEDMLRGREHLLDQGFGAADVMMASNLLLVPYYVRLNEFPGIQAYQARMAERAGYQRAVARDGQQDMFTRDFYPVPEG